MRAKERKYKFSLLQNFTLLLHWNYAKHQNNQPEPYRFYKPLSIFTYYYKDSRWFNLCYNQSCCEDALLVQFVNEDSQRIMTANLLLYNSTNSKRMCVPFILQFQNQLPVSIIFGSMGLSWTSKPASNKKQHGLILNVRSSEDVYVDSVKM